MSYGSFRGKYLGQPPGTAKALELLLYRRLPLRDTGKTARKC